MNKGRPKDDLSCLPENWYKDVLNLYKEGASDVEIKALIYQWKGSFSNDLWDRWIKENKKFKNCIIKGREIRPFIRVNKSTKHIEKLKKRRENRKKEYHGSNKLIQSYRSLFSYHIKNSKATIKGSKFDLFGYSKKDLINHIKKNLKKGMNLDNYGEWHLDHVKPASWFNHNNEKDIIDCWSLSNLDPKWAFENMSKGNRYEG
tara:strand:- start:423 stop:1031 length:609 start_codon:yes stop_codon:yes gene_type:complete